MMHQPPPLHTHQSNPSRNGHGRDYTSSHPASDHVNVQSSRHHHHTTSHSANSSRRRRLQSNGHANNRQYYEQTESDSDLDLESNTYHDMPLDQRQFNVHQGHPHYRKVPRPWRPQNPELDQVLHDPALEDLTARTHHRNTYQDDYHFQNHNPAHYRQLLHNEYPRPDVRLDQYNGWPLGMTNLRNLNQDRQPVSAMERRMDEEQRAGPYVAVGYVGRQSDYDLDNGYEEYEEQNGYEEYEEQDKNGDPTEYDARSSTFC